MDQSTTEWIGTEGVILRINWCSEQDPFRLLTLKKVHSHLALARKGAKVIVILGKYIGIIGLKKRRGFLPLEGEGGPFHDRVDWDGRGDFGGSIGVFSWIPSDFCPLKKVQKPPSLAKGRSKSNCYIGEIH